MAALARSQGWRAIWRAPLDSKGGGGWDAALGGVGVLYRPGMAMQMASRRQANEDAQDLWHSTRWLHVHLAYARGKWILNLQVVHGVSGQPKVRLWGAVTQYIARLGNTPHMNARISTSSSEMMMRCPKNCSQQNEWATCWT